MKGMLLVECHVERGKSTVTMVHLINPLFTCSVRSKFEFFSQYLVHRYSISIQVIGQKINVCIEIKFPSYYLFR